MVSWFVGKARCDLLSYCDLYFKFVVVVVIRILRVFQLIED